MILILLIAFPFCAMFCIWFFLLRNVPYGYEDKDGFHYTQGAGMVHRPTEAPPDKVLSAWIRRNILLRPL